MRRKKGAVVEEVKYHCPHEECLYSEGSERYFSKKFNLKQHLLKVHTEKSFACTKCKVKTFASEKLLAYHEKNCGIAWTCSCGSNYDMRETLLTHARRTQHQLPENIQPPKKRERDCEVKIPRPSFENGIRYIPIITINSNAQTDSNFFKLLNPTMEPTSLSQFRPILPKPRTKVINGLRKKHFFDSDYLVNPVIYKVENTTQTDDLSGTPRGLTTNDKTSFNSKKPIESRSIETQTYRRSNLRKNFKKMTEVESRGSQCYPRNKSRRRSVRLESIETQTTEIILDKMKEVLRSNVNKSNSVDESSETAESVLNCLDLLLNSNWSKKSKLRCSSGTQTSPRCKRAKETCDSQAGTDNAEDIQDFGMLSLLATVCQRMATEMITQQSKSNYCSDKDSNDSSNDSHDEKIVFNAKQIESQSYRKRKSPSSQSALNSTASPLDIETQTSDVLSNFLSNTETQTTLEDEDGFLFPELELSDIQTQTPWTDFFDFYNNLDDGHSLSAEIQTDITFNSDFVGLNVGTWNDDDPASAILTDTETQTQCHGSTSPTLEFTSSYTQTLDQMRDLFALDQNIHL